MSVNNITRYVHSTVRFVPLCTVFNFSAHKNPNVKERSTALTCSLTRSACISPHVTSFTKFYTAMFLTRKLAKEMLPIIHEKKMRMIFPFNIPSNFFYSCAGLLLLWTENFYTTWRLRGTLNFFFVIRIKRIFTTKTEKFHLHGNNSMCAGAFQLLRTRAA